MSKWKPKEVNRVVLRLLLVCMALFAVAAISQVKLLFVPCVAVFALAVGLHLVYYRCPHCGKFLDRSTGDFCPYCGKNVNETEE